jgi:hypothetical protein
VPRKYGFTLLLGERVFSLDVNPARMHNNRDTRELVSCTHWTTWPCRKAQPDDRTFNHKQWFREFCLRARIAFSGDYNDPPYLGGEQEPLL